MIPTDEDQRLQLIQDLNILQHFQNDETFERMTFLASEFFKCPMALITIVGEKSLWFLTNVGLESLHEGIRKISFCQHVIMPDAPECFVIPDASKDSRFHENPLVTGSLHIRFYAASPIYLQDVKVGTFCLLDTVPRDDFDTEKEKRLIELARNVSDMMLEKKLEFVNCGNSQMTLDILQNLTGEIVGTLKNMIGLQEELRHTHRAVQTITNNNNNSKKKKSTPASTPTNAEVTASSSSKSVEVEEMELLTTLEMKKQELFEQRLFIQGMLQKGLTSLNNLQKNNAHNKSHHELSSMMVKPSPRNATTATKSESVFLPPHHAFVRGQYIALPQWFNKLKQLTINQLPHYHLIAKHVKWDLKMSTTSSNSSNVNNNLNAFEVNEGVLPFLSIFLSFLLICQSQKWKHLKLSFVLYPQNDVQSISPPTSRRSSIKSTTRSMTQSSDLDDPQVLPSQVINTTSSKKETRKVYRVCTGEAAQNHSFHLLYGKLAVEVKAHGKITHTTQKNNNSSLISPAALSLSSSKSKPPTPLSNSSSSLSASLLPASDAYPLFPEENQFFSICDNFIANSFQIMQGEYQKYYNRNEEMTNFWVACFMKENILSTSSSTPTASASATSFSPRNAALFFGGTSSKKREQPPAKLLSLKEDEEKNDNNEKNIININSSNNSDKEKNKKLTGFISNQVSKVGSFFNSSINRFLMNDWMNRTSSTHTVPSTVPALSDVIEPMAVVKKSPTLRPEPLSIGSGSQSNESDESEPQSKEDATFSEHVKATQRTKETMVEEFSLSYQESIMENEAVAEKKRKSQKKSKSPSSNSPISSVHSTPRHSGRFFFPSTTSKVHVSND